MKISLLPFLVLVAAIIVIGGYFVFKGGNSKSNLGLSGLNVTGSPTASNSPSPESSGQGKVVKATMITTGGNIELELYPETAPKTVANFVKLAQDKFYDGTKFHRVVPDFVVQGGDSLSKTDDPRVGTGGPGYTFEDEINPKSLGIPDDVIAQYEAQGYKYDFSLRSLPVDPGYIAMANAGPGTNGSQFFIVTTEPQQHLYGKHTVFGKVISGMDVVLKVKQGDVLRQVKITE